MVNYFIGEVYKVDRMGAIPVGVVVERSAKFIPLKKGMKSVIDGKTIEIVSLESHHEQLEESKKGTPVAISFIIHGKKKRNNLGNKTEAEIEEEYNLIKNYINKEIIFN